MKQPSEKILADVAAQTFENLAFMFVVPEEEADGRASAAQVVAAVGFEGPLSGRLVVAVDSEMLPALASNMLGLSADQTPSLVEQRDALRELANVICGNLLPEIAGRQPLFTVHPPALIDTSTVPDVAAGAEPSATAMLLLDAGTARLALYVSGPSDVLVTPTGGLAAND